MNLMPRTSIEASLWDPWLVPMFPRQLRLRKGSLFEASFGILVEASFGILVHIPLTGCASHSVQPGTRSYLASS